VTLPYGESREAVPGLEVRFADAGHILGSAVVALTVYQAGRDHRLTFTGDLGRRGLPFLHDPSPVPAGDLVICESTYGGKTHDTLQGMASKMADVVRRTAGRGGKVLIPAFSLGRTQIVLHFIRRWMADGLLPRLPIYVDSPLAAEIGLVYEEYAHCLAAREVDEIPFEYLVSQEDAWFRTTESEPCVIIASGGMCEGGRIVQHLKHHVDDPRSAIALVSYQAPGTLGAPLLEMRPTVRFHGRTWNKWIEVVEVNGFSGHADQEDFKALLGPAAERTGKVRLVHGELPQSEALAGSLRRLGFADVDTPTLEEAVCVG